MPTLNPTAPLHLRAGETSLVLCWPDPEALPVVAHWGADLGECTEDELAQLASALVPPTVSDQMEAVPLCTLLPDPSRAWYGTPGFELVLHGAADHSITQLRHLRTETVTDTSLTISSVPTDWPEAVTVTVELEMFGTGLLRQRASVEVTGDEPVEVVSLTLAMPVPTPPPRFSTWPGTTCASATPSAHRSRSAPTCATPEGGAPACRHRR